MTTHDCRALVASARTGDEEAFAQLYRMFGRAVHGTLLARVAPDDAGDLVQEVFLRAWSRLRDLRDDNAFGAWICTIARRYAATHYHRRKTFVPLPEGLAVDEQTHVQAEAHAALAAIQLLPEAYRETLTLRLVEGLSGPEIASITGLTAESVRVNLHRGFSLLRERLGVTS